MPLPPPPPPVAELPLWERGHMTHVFIDPYKNAPPPPPYIMLDGVNDQEKNPHQLGEWLHFK
ncbi:hypothetical protein YC2023_067328 [Brassica napus]